MHVIQSEKLSFFDYFKIFRAKLSEFCYLFFSDLTNFHDFLALSMTLYGWQNGRKSFISYKIIILCPPKTIWG